MEGGVNVDAACVQNIDKRIGDACVWLKMCMSALFFSRNFSKLRLTKYT